MMKTLREKLEDYRDKQVNQLAMITITDYEDAQNELRIVFIKELNELLESSKDES